MNFKVGDRVVYSFDIRDKTFNHFGVIKKLKESKYGLCTVFFPKENIELFFTKENIELLILGQSLTLQPTVNKEDLL